MCVFLCACGSAKTYVAYTYSVETGDTVKIRLDTSDGYSFSSKLPFEISKDEKLQSQGTFITKDDYNQYALVVEEDEYATILDKGEKDGNTYVFWSYNDSEYNYAIYIEDSNTGVLLGNVISEESAEECFARMEISIDN